MRQEGREDPGCRPDRADLSGRPALAQTDAESLDSRLGGGCGGRREDHVFVINLTDSFNARTESGSGTNPPSGECCTPAPNVLEYDAAGVLVGHWGGPGQGGGYDWPEQNRGIAVDDSGNVWIGGTAAPIREF